MISPGGIILDVNPAACEALGYTKEELIGKAVSIIYAPESHTKMRDLGLRSGRRRDGLKAKR